MREIINPKDISRLSDSDGRRELSQEIKQMHANILYQISDIKDNMQVAESSLAQLKNRMDSLTQNRFRWFSIFRLKELKDIELQAQKISEELNNFKKQLKDLLSQLHDQNNLIKETMLKPYYRKIERKPLTISEKERNLKPENLTRLSTEEYIKLWRRLNPYWLAYVTRHGVRDHASMLFHTGGIGEYSSGALSLFQNGQLRPPIYTSWGITGDLQTDKQSVSRLLKQHIIASPSEGGAVTKEEATQRFLDLIQSNPYNTAYPYADITTLHFSAMDILNDYYGAEQKNDIVFIVPPDVMASQFYFYFNTGDAYADFSKPVDDRKWNDVFVWSKSGSLKNMKFPVDAALVFIPENALVDGNTGSKYAIDENGRRIVDDNIKLKFESWLNDIRGDHTLKNKFNDYIEARSRRESETKINELKDEIKSAFYNSLLHAGIDDERAGYIVHTIFHGIGDVYTEFLKTGQIARSIKQSNTIISPSLRVLKSSNAIWKRPKNPVRSKEYWESVFAKSPGIKPRHVIYYNGEPAEAVTQFLKQNGISSRRQNTQEYDRFLGFAKNRIVDLKKDERSNPDFKYIVDLAREIIDEHFSDS